LSPKIAPDSHESSFHKYAGYALGEIILIVLGILIALWLNNLNIQRQERVEEIAIPKG
jgi:high-affinity Fe2+/Pb2+ permease